MNRKIEKKHLSLYLRTQCDRELFLSLHKGAELKARNMPEPLEARAGIAALNSAGQGFESEKNELLIKHLGDSVIFNPKKNNQFDAAPTPLESLLPKVTESPSFILQSKFEVGHIQKSILQRLGVKATDLALIPHIGGLIPDIIIARNSLEGDEEVRADGTRKQIGAEDSRQALIVIDIKHTNEANTSYRAEIAFYIIFLANWLLEEGLNKQFFVSSQGHLWTRVKQDRSAFEHIINTTDDKSTSAVQYLPAILDDCEDANVRFFLPIVARFFREDVPRVLKKAGPDGINWDKLEWHVDNRCGSCDWLGLKKWASQKDKKKIDKNPTHYCYTAAKQKEHLSRIPGVTRGARKTLEKSGIKTTSAIAESLPSAKVYQEHSLLKRECQKLPNRALALTQGTISLDQKNLLATLSPSPSLHMAIIINFDPSAGLLTGLSVIARVTTYTKGASPRYFAPESFVVDQKTVADEWTALEGFISKLGEIFEQSESYIKSKKIRAQIAFWEKRQFEELCSAFGRHLPKVLDLKKRNEKALAWLFPPEELLEKADGVINPAIVFVEEIIKNVVFVPTPHVITLLDVAEQYYEKFPIKETDAYYREQLSNGVPKERIYEIWSGVDSINRGDSKTPRNSIIARYTKALDTQAKALDSITRKLREDFKDKIKGKAYKLNLSIPQGAKKISFDGKLWVWWDDLDFYTNNIEAHQRLALDGITLEANFEGIRLTNGQTTGDSSNEYIYDVLPGSVDTKLETGASFLALGSERCPGLPLYRGSDIISEAIPDDFAKIAYCPLWSSIKVTLVDFDREKRKAKLKFTCWGNTQFVKFLFKNSSVSLTDDVFIMKGKSSYNWSKYSKKILEEVGVPSIAKDDPNAIYALGRKKGTSPKVSSEITPIASVLWDAYTLSQNKVRNENEASKIANFAQHHEQLNESQTKAVQSAASQQLTIIWGPPGTGKTKTLAAFISATACVEGNSEKGLKILITGPTYRAVEEVLERAIRNLDSKGTTHASVFAFYSDYQTPKTFSSDCPLIKVHSIQKKDKTLFSECISQLRKKESVTIIGTTCHQAFKFSETINNKMVGEVFDIVIIDESSQVPVTKALSPFATLKQNSRLIIAGDHMQMPPIQAVDAPLNAEYLVGSIQTYLLKRDFGSPISKCQLEVNYRSAKEFVEYAHTIGYSTRLKAQYDKLALVKFNNISDQSNDFPSSLPWSDLWEPAIDPQNKIVSLLHSDDMSSQSNLHEAQIVASLVWGLRTTVCGQLSTNGEPVSEKSLPCCEEFWTQCIGIVTPHRAQRALIVRVLTQLFPDDDSQLIEQAIDTVEKFQGGERNSIIVSFGIGDADIISGEEAFLMQLERTNVAISRAKAKCIVIMPYTLASHVPEDKKALETAFALKNYVDEFCNNQIEGTIRFGETDIPACVRYRG